MLHHHYAIYSSLYYPHPGGVESYTFNMARTLVAQGERVTVVTMRIDDSPARELMPEGIEVVRLPCHAMLGGRLPWTKRNHEYRQMEAMLDNTDFDRVFVNTRFYPHSIEGLKLAQRKAIPAVVLDHGSAHLVIGNKFLDAVIQIYEHIITNMVKRYHPKFFGVSEMSCQWLSHFGIHAQGVIPNAIDSSDFRNAAIERDFRKECGIPSDAFVVVYVGRLTPEKGPSKVISAAKTLEKSSCHFVLAGDGFLRKSLEIDAPASVHFVGNLEKGELSALLQQSDAFCLPTRSEGFCTSLLEAAACELPAVIPDVGGAREVIPNSSFGFILDQCDVESIAAALQKLYFMDASERNAMGKSVRNRVETLFSWGESAERVDRAFD